MLNTDLQSSYNYNSDDQDNMINSIDDLTNETPSGWSSICLDQTIHYYINCNIAQNKEDSM